MQTHTTASSSKGGIIIVLLIIVVILVAGFFVFRWAITLPPSIPFASYGNDYASKPDFAQVEYQYPLTKEQRMKLTPQNIQKFDQEQVDQIYARLTAGPIPDGPHDGDLFFAKGIRGRARLAEIVG